MAVETSTGLEKSAERRQHFDIYAIVEGTQELYFGHETSVNVNLVETVKIDHGNGQVDEKCYLSPTKRRGVERRALIWSPLADGRLLGDRLGCGIPHTCTRQDCPICSVFGGLITSDATMADKTLPGGNKRKANTFIGRLVHGGGVAIQPILPTEKQRAMHPSMLNKAPGDDPTPTPFKREYNEPALLYPVYNHAMSVSDREFSAAAYAFLEGIKRIGAGNPKGVRLFEKDNQPLLVLDRYLVPLGKRPVLSPTITDVPTAVDQFERNANSVVLQDGVFKDEDGVFMRWYGDAALARLQQFAVQFAKNHLMET